jgi:hypothetical protein
LPVRFANIFLVAYAVDAAVSLVGLALPEASAFSGVQRSLASFVYLGALVCIPLVAISARLPMPMLLTLCMSVFWLSTGGVPLPLTFAPDASLPVVLTLLQCSFALAAFFRVRQLNRGSGWFLEDDAETGPRFSFAHSLRFIATIALIVTPLVLGYILLSLATWIEVGTERFVRVNLTGVQLSDRLYTKDEKQIRLVGMMHLGEDETYRALAESFVSENTIVLEEGVSDRDGIFTDPISYDKLARSLGLRAQRSIGEYLSPLAADDPRAEWPVIQNADVDAQAFSPETVAYLGLAAGVWSSDDPLLAFLEIYRDTLEHPDNSKLLIHDVIELRNQHLLAEIERALPIYERVIVPWGALHLPQIERDMLALGFIFEDETLRQVIAWETLSRALF